VLGILTDRQTIRVRSKDWGKVVWQFSIFTISFFIIGVRNLLSGEKISFYRSRRRCSLTTSLFPPSLSPKVSAVFFLFCFTVFANLSFLFAFVANDDQNQHIIKLNSLRGGSLPLLTFVYFCNSDLFFFFFREMFVYGKFKSFLNFISV